MLERATANLKGAFNITTCSTYNTPGDLCSKGPFACWFGLLRVLRTWSHCVRNLPLQPWTFTSRPMDQEALPQQRLDGLQEALLRVVGKAVMLCMALITAGGHIHQTTALFQYQLAFFFCSWLLLLFSNPLFSNFFFYEHQWPCHTECSIWIKSHNQLNDSGQMRQRKFIPQGTMKQITFNKCPKSLKQKRTFQYSQTRMLNQTLSYC